MIQQPHPTMQASGLPGATDHSKISRVSPFSAKKISVTSGDQSAVAPKSARRQGIASMVMKAPTRVNTNGQRADDEHMHGDMTPPLSPTSHMGRPDIASQLIISPRAEIN